ncbi:hypothetical protein B296_00036865 [Ensete ventricosum]|uniref:HTH OST-type domain-containing protein n=1 Tax=Ensete ventricosum TaxID=4639 RepID=A0A427A150_ENSVE|nr:hypothetical protein B296_00036865 [Ensete ventricosum]
MLVRSISFAIVNFSILLSKKIPADDSFLIPFSYEFFFFINVSTVHKNLQLLCIVGGKNSSDRFLMADLVYWVSQNPPPAHFFLISGDRDFANILHRLRMSNYNILLSSKDGAPGVLCSAATFMWPWSSLVKGESTIVKHFNHPPDRLYESWYGHCKAVLDDPFSDIEQAANSQCEESMGLISETKPRPVPKALVSAIRQILYSYPEGLYLPELRTELKRINATMDKDFFGYKKFSHLLASMPNILKIIPNPSLEGQLLVVSTHRKIADSVPSRFKPVQDVDVSDGENNGALRKNGKPLPITPPSNKSEPASTISETIANEKGNDSDSGKQNSSPTQGQDVVDLGGLLERIKGFLFGHQRCKTEPFSPIKGNDMEGSAYASTSEHTNNTAPRKGFAHRIIKVWSYRSSGQRVGGTDSISGLDSISHEDSGEAQSICKPTEKLKFEDKATQSKHNFSNQPSASANSTEASESILKDKTIEQSETSSGSPDMNQSFFSQIGSWWRFWKSNKDQNISSTAREEVINYQEDVACEKSNNDLGNIIGETELHDVFSKGYFWDALESFLLTSKGSELILKSRTRLGLFPSCYHPKSTIDDQFRAVATEGGRKKKREKNLESVAHGARAICCPWAIYLPTTQLVHGLQKEGPWVLKDLTETQLFKLVNLIIMEKKWLEESTSQTFPFRLSLASKRKCGLSHVPGSSGLSSLFTGRTSKPSTHRQVEQETLDHNPGCVRNAFDKTLDAKPPQNFVELKAWFQKAAYKGLEDVEPEDLQKLFESKFNTKLVSSVYGYPSLQSLIAACLTDVDFFCGKRKSSPSREEILSDCHKLLLELFDEYPEGFNMSIFKPTFIEKYGYILDFQMLGYPKLASLLQIMPGVRIESSFIIPSERFRSDSSWSKQPIVGKLDDSSPDEKSNSINKDSKGESTSEDYAWEELGPLSETVIHDGNTVAQVNDKKVSYDEASLSDDDFSASEGDSPSQSGELESKSQRCGEDSSLLQILDSWYGSKEGGAKDQAQAVDSLVDYSKIKTMDLKPINEQKVKARPTKRYCFVSKSPNDEKERLVDNILGSLKKAGDSKLHS